MKTREAPDFAPTRNGTPTMRRITPREALAAYEATGATPVANIFALEQGGQMEACPLGAIIVAHTGEWPLSAVIEDYLRQRFSVLGGEYGDGFAISFDGAAEESLDGIICATGYEDVSALWFRWGYRDGRRCRRFVFGESA